MAIPSVANWARFYALSKIHKPTLSFRQIVSNVDTAPYKLNHFLSNSLAHMTSNNLFTVKNSYDFVDKLKLISPSNYTMLSLQVKSLFTNVPIQGESLASYDVIIQSIIQSYLTTLVCGASLSQKDSMCKLNYF